MVSEDTIKGLEAFEERDRIARNQERASAAWLKAQGLQFERVDDWWMNAYLGPGRDAKNLVGNIVGRPEKGFAWMCVLTTGGMGRAETEAEAQAGLTEAASKAARNYLDLLLLPGPAAFIVRYEDGTETMVKAAIDGSTVFPPTAMGYTVTPLYSFAAP